MTSHAASTERPDMLEQALVYRARGWPVFPICRPHGEGRCEQHGRCPSAGKRPLVRWEAFQTRVPTEGEVRQWWRKWPTANIGMATGATAGIVVLDADGSDARKEALQRGGLDETPAVWTGKPGGAHYHLAHPGQPVHNFARRLPGLDFRGDGGYVLLPPSRHAQGADYRWVEGTDSLRPASMPAWLDALLRSGPASTANGTDSDHTPLDPAGLLAGIPEGARDDTLYRWACKLRNDDVPQGYAELLLRQAARLCRPPFDEAIAVEKVQRAYRAFTPTPRLDEWPGDDAGDEEDDNPFANAEPEPDEPWAIYDAADYLVRDLPDVTWVIPGFLRDQSIVFNFGAPGSIKTYIATDAALAVATGGQFLGQFPCTRGKVLIVQEDTVDSDYQRAYLGPLAAARGLTPEDLRDWLFVAPPGGFSLEHGPRLAQLYAWMTEHRPALVIFDAFYLLHSGDGFGKDLSPALARLKHLRRHFGCAVWMIDHDRKEGKEGSSGNPVDRLYGGRQKSAAVDALLESRPVQGTHGVTLLHMLKLRGAAPLEPVEVTLEEGVLRSTTASTENSAGATQQVYEWLLAEGASRTKAMIVKGTGLGESTVRKALDLLQAHRRVRKTDPGAGRGRVAYYLGLREPDDTSWTPPGSDAW